MNKFFTLLILFITVTVIQAGTPEKKSQFTSEKAMFKQAERYFVKKDYENAAALYAQLISTADPGNYRLNYCYGICLLILDKDKSQSVKYLEDASKSIEVWDDVWYYLGRAYQLNNEFEKAISCYDQFVKVVSPKQALRWEGIHQMEMCKNAEVMMKTADSTEILETKTVSEDQLYSAYLFINDNRKLLSLPDEFSIEKDRKNPDCSKMFLSANGNRMVFASYGTEASTNTDIYMAEKNDRGIWGKPVKLGETVNTKYDEAFPTLSEEGDVLYFSSKGHNSMGGYDVFKSNYYPQTKQWSKAENMGVPVNSSDDDFYYVSSELESIAYFSSRRGSSMGEVKVFKIKTNANGGAKLVINGEVINEYAAPYRQAKIKITRQRDGEVVADFTSDGVNGKYRYLLAETGSYRVSVRVEGFGPMAQSITFSENASGRVKQTVSVSKDANGYDNLRIVNIFEENSNGSAFAKEKDSSGLEHPGPLQSHINPAPSTEQPANANDPVNMYSVAGLPPFNEESKEKLDNYFNEVHEKSPELNTDNLINLATANEVGTNYKVQIGTFMHQTVEQVYAKLVEMGFDDVSYYTNKKGWKIFYTGHAKDIASTLKLKDIVINYGFEDAFITVYENGKPSRPGKK